jgi:acid stress-induced BolA-like protein IbaG/YrbA
MVTNESIQQLLQESFQGAEVSVAQSGSKFDVRIVSDEFEGLRAIKRQQRVYAAFGDLITSGAVHAISINALTADEWKQQSRFGSNF